MSTGQLRDNYDRIRERMFLACQRGGRRLDDVRLLAVSKFQPATMIGELADAGQQGFGENYVQEALEKKDVLAKEGYHIQWDMIGHVQSRKAPLVAGAFNLIHTVDSIKLAKAIEKHLSGESQKILIEVNIGEEKQKSGVLPEDLPNLAREITENAPHLELRGLMCMPPVYDAGEAARPYFTRLGILRDELAKDLHMDLPELSMGMSGDFEVAIEEGATIVRVGSAIFGPRPMRKG